MEQKVFKVEKQCKNQIENRTVQSKDINLFVSKTSKLKDHSKSWGHHGPANISGPLYGPTHFWSRFPVPFPVPFSGSTFRAHHGPANIFGPVFWAHFPVPHISGPISGPIFRARSYLGSRERARCHFAPFTIVNCIYCVTLQWQK